jgi:hypothetical protein
MELFEILNKLEKGLDHSIVNKIKEDLAPSDVHLEGVKHLLPSNFPICSHKDCVSLSNISCDYCYQNVCSEHYTKLHHLSCAGGCGIRECVGEHPGQPTYPNDGWEQNADGKFECYDCRTSIRRVLFRR